MKLTLLSIWGLCMMMFMSVLAFAQEAAEVVEEGAKTIAENGAQAAAAVAEEVPISSIIDQLLALIQNTDGLGTLGLVSAALMLLISTTKNSLLRGLIWDKLGSYKALVAPLLGLIVFVLGFQEFSWKGVLLGLTSGAGAVAFYELLKVVRDLPGIGPTWVSVIDFVGKLLKRPDKKE